MINFVNAVDESKKVLAGCLDQNQTAQNVLSRHRSITRTKKKSRVTYEDSFKGYNVIIRDYIYFLHEISSFQSSFNPTDFHYSRSSNEICSIFYVPGVSFSS